MWRNCLKVYLKEQEQIIEMYWKEFCCNISIRIAYKWHHSRIRLYIGSPRLYAVIKFIMVMYWLTEYLIVFKSETQLTTDTLFNTRCPHVTCEIVM